MSVQFSSNGCFLSVLTALTGEIFADKESAFTQFHGWCAVGNVITFSTGNVLCFRHKAYVLLASTALGLVTYAGLEVTLKVRGSRAYSAVRQQDADIGIKQSERNGIGMTEWEPNELEAKSVQTIPG